MEKPNDVHQTFLVCKSSSLGKSLVKNVWRFHLSKLFQFNFVCLKHPGPNLFGDVYKFFPPATSTAKKYAQKYKQTIRGKEKNRKSINKPNKIQCPMHGWSFSALDGKCAQVPYSAGSVGKLPEKARLRVWHSSERNRHIYVWFAINNLCPNFNYIFFQNKFHLTFY